MAEKSVVLHFLELSFPVFSVKRPFSNNVSVYYSCRGKEADEARVLYVCESLFQLQQVLHETESCVNGKSQVNCFGTGLV